MQEPREALILPDLNEVIEQVAQHVRSFDEVRQIADRSDLRDAEVPSSGKAAALWTPVFRAALESAPETLPRLLNNIRRGLGQRPLGEVDEALNKVRERCISRFLLDSHPEVGDQADALLLAEGVQEMIAAAKRLRDTAIGVRRLLLRPFLADTFLQIQEMSGAPFQDRDWLRTEMADQAVDVVTAVDYLLFLLHTQPRSGQLNLGGDSSSERMQSRTDEEALDWLTRRRLVARGEAVTQGQRMLAALRKHSGLG